jgi:hypothetical protein
VTSGPGGWAWASRGGSRTAAWTSWLSTAVIVVGIWSVTSLASTDWIYPWPVWVVGPWGVVLLARTPTESRDRGRDRDRGRRLPSRGTARAGRVREPAAVPRLRP